MVRRLGRVIMALAAISQLARAQATPTLVEDHGRNMAASRGGTARVFTITSAILKETRTIDLVLPPSFSRTPPDRHYPVIIVSDGDFLVTPVSAVVDELTRNGQIPESVIVGIENTGATQSLDADQKRVYDLTPPGLSVSGSDSNQGGDLYLDFIEKELLPAVDRQFRTAAPRLFVGASSGGILATYVAATRDTFSGIVSLDAPISVSNSWLAKKFMERIERGGAPVRYASMEALYGWPDDKWEALRAKAPPSWVLYRERLKLEGHESMHMIGAYIGLRQLFAGYSRFSTHAMAANAIWPHYAQLSAAFGGSLLPPERVLQETIRSLAAEGRGASAREALNLLTFAYGEPANSAKLMAEIGEAERRAPPVTVESLLATPFPTPDQARPFLGEWVGDINMAPGSPRDGNTRLKIYVENGRVIGETINATPDGEIVKRWDYFKITPHGFDWGKLNEKLPRGVMLFEGTMEGDMLHGKGQFAGINLEDPPPPLIFSFKHQRK